MPNIINGGTDTSNINQVRRTYDRRIKMPLTKKGKKIKSAMMKTYGVKKGKKVFYASENKGSIKGVAKSSHSDVMRGVGAMM